jgi:hypothetical protein
MRYELKPIHTVTKVEFRVSSACRRARCRPHDERFGNTRPPPTRAGDVATTWKQLYRDRGFHRGESERAAAGHRA